MFLLPISLSLHSYLDIEITEVLSLDFLMCELRIKRASKS